MKCVFDDEARRRRKKLLWARLDEEERPQEFPVPSPVVFTFFSFVVVVFLLSSVFLSHD